MYAVVAGIGFPAAARFFPLGIRNVTALALVAAWVVAEWVVYQTGNSLPVSFYFKADIAVIAVIYAKTIMQCRSKIYEPGWNQLGRMVTDLTLWDRWIVAIFLLGAWPLYILNLHPSYKWQALMWLSIAQFLLAGGEAIAGFREERRKASDTPIIDRHLVVVQFPVQNREADAVRNPPEDSGELLIAKVRGYG